MALAIALLSLAVSIINIYLTQLRPGRLSVYLGPEIGIYHSDYPEVSTGMYVPVTFTNSAPNMVVVYRVAISIFREDSPGKKRHFMIWHEFAKAVPGGWGRDSPAHSFAITGKSSVSKTLWFMVFHPFAPKLVFKEGRYKLRVHVWTDNQARPLTFKSGFDISSMQAQNLQEFIKKEDSTTLLVLLNKELQRNMLLSEEQVEYVLLDTSPGGFYGTLPRLFRFLSRF